MKPHVRLWALIALVLLTVFPSVANARGVYNKEGFWEVGVVGEVCMAGVFTEDGGTFALRAEKGEVVFAAATKRPLAKGRKGVLETDAYTIDFAPAFDKAGKYFEADAPLSSRGLAALRLARGLKILLDGREVISVELEGTGFDSALDAVTACSKGESGWWGKGAGAEAARSEAPAKPGEPVLNEEGFWSVGADQEDDFCFATAKVDGGAIILTGEDGFLSFGYGADRAMRQGRKGTFETDAHGFKFTPTYESDTYLYLDEAMSARAVAALRLARSLKLAVDGRTLFDTEVEDTGLDGVLDALIGCSKGQRGWWGEGVNSAAADARPAGGGSGSAFFLSADGIAVTAAHVVDGCGALQSPRWGAIKVLATDPRADLAILKAEQGSGAFVPLRSRGPKLGETVSAGGYPLGGLLGSGLKITTGVVSGLSGPAGDRGLFQISASIQPGNSGGPVIDAGGALIGVTAAKLDELKFAGATGAFPQNVNFAVPVTILQAFLDENGVKYRTSAAPAPAPAADLSGYTFSLVCSR